MSTRELAVVTGAHGFVGRHVARRLVRKGYLVYGIGHGHWSSEEWTQWGLAKWLAADITVENLRCLPVSPDVIVHCAGSGSVSFSHQNPLLDFERTVTSTVEVLEYLRTVAPGAGLVYPSSASVYGNCSISPISETTPPAPISQYGVHKRMAEQLILSWAQRFSIPAAIVRLFSAYGPGLRKQLLWDACQKLAAGDNMFMGTGDEVRDWLHVEDAAELLAQAATQTHTLCPTVNGGSGEGISVRHCLEHLAETLLGEPAPIFFSSEPRPGDPATYIADTSAARRWSWRPSHPWRAGIAEYVAWWSGENRNSMTAAAVSHTAAH